MGELELLEESIPSLLDDEGEEIPTIEVDDETLRQSKTPFIILGHISKKLTFKKPFFKCFKAPTFTRIP